MFKWFVICAAIVSLAGCETGGSITTIDLLSPVDQLTQDGSGEIVSSTDLLPVDLGPDLRFDLTSDGTIDVLTSDFWGPTEGEAGWPCQSGDDCLSGYCILTADGKQCTVACEQECPFGWECVAYQPALPDQVFLCLPRYLTLCKPCHDNNDCTAGGGDMGQTCVQYGSPGNFCGGPCTVDGDCPDGYICKLSMDVTGGQSSQCALQVGDCECVETFVNEASSTTCSQENEFGTCVGERSCNAFGLTPCSAATPTAEACNGLDDNCDGEVDEGTSGQECLIANSFGACPGVEECSTGKLTCLGDTPKMELCDGEDNDCDGLTDEDFADTDGDGTADCLENDKDGDGISDGLDNCPGSFNPDQKDFDLDNIGNVCDPDDDNDLTPDELVCMPYDAAAHPGGEEICDGKDNDCNALVDEGHTDTDADGWKDCIDTDDDNDGIDDGQDCKPLDPLTFPGAAEICDGMDNNCDFTADEGFADVDGDGKADCADLDLDGDGAPNDSDNCPATVNEDQADLDNDGIGDACDSDIDGDAIPNGADNCPELKNTLQANSDDDEMGDLCDEDDDNDDVLDDDDNCPLVANPEQVDSDEDGLGDACEGDTDGDGVANAQDCAPLNPAIFPGAPEVCDGADNDCDLAEDEGFPDGDLDGIKDCVDADDDNDGDPDESDCAPTKPAIFTGAEELCDDIDNNCNDLVDEELGILSCGKGACSHKIAACAAGETQFCDPYEGAAEELCDAIDNDCDGLTDEDLGSTTCGLGACAHTVANCANGQPQECDPLAGAVAEFCDGIDNDCDGKTDEEMESLACGKGICFHTVQSCVGGVIMDCNPFAGAQPESCDGLDNDCDGEKDEDLGTVVCGVGECQHDMEYCVDGKIAVCNPFLGAAVEVCDAQDNDCNGLVDENLLPVTCGKGICTHTVEACIDGVPQECDPLAGALPEQCDGFDNDCDGLVDEGLGFATCGLGACAHTVANCTDGQTVECDPLEGAGDEVCDGEDNDCDGVTDPEDATDCNTYYRDGDSDGFGLTDDAKCLCAADPPYISDKGGDCADDNDGNNPDKTDSCTTAADEDCSGAANEGCVYASCKALLEYIPGTASGAYTIDPDGDGGQDPFDVYCDMETDGGGWTLVMKQGSKMGYTSPLAVQTWSGWSQANVTMNPTDATLDDANMVNLAYSTLTAEKIRLTASTKWTDLDNGAWSRTVNQTPFNALSNANANKTGNEGGTDNTPWAAASFTDHTWTSTTTGNGLCWRAGPWFNRTSYQYTSGGIKWGWFFNNECHENTTDTAEGLGCCGNSSWYRESAWALYLWAK